MKIVGVKELAIPDVKVVRFARFQDQRGYFTEPFRRSDFNRELPFLRGSEFLQANESYSRANTIRGLHFQWNPFMGKLVRTVHGRMIDLFLDIRIGSPTQGKIAAYDMPSAPDATASEWIWVPPGFAHGNVFTSDTTIEYFCTGEYSQGCEAGISPLASDLDWSLCEPELHQVFRTVADGAPLISDKDRQAPCAATWWADPRSLNFQFDAMLKSLAAA